MQKRHALLAIAAAGTIGLTAVATPAMAGNETNTNEIWYWQNKYGLTCTKIPTWDGTQYTATKTHALVVVNAANQNIEYRDVAAGQVLDSTRNHKGNLQDISHVIVCDCPPDEPTTSPATSTGEVPASTTPVTIAQTVPTTTTVTETTTLPQQTTTVTETATSTTTVTEHHTETVTSTAPAQTSTATETTTASAVTITETSTTTAPGTTVTETERTASTVSANDEFPAERNSATQETPPPLANTGLPVAGTALASLALIGWGVAFIGRGKKGEHQ